MDQVQKLVQRAYVLKKQKKGIEIADNKYRDPNVNNELSNNLH